MKITITTPTGNIGRALTGHLLGGHAELTLIARTPEKVAEFAARGARVVEGSLDDLDLVKQASDGADALFWVSPPNYEAENFRAYYNSMGDIVARVARERPDLHVVHLSSTGAHLAEGTGPVKGLYDIEQKLNTATRRVTHLRPTYFMENVMSSLATIASAGAIFSTIPPAVSLPQIATRDVAVVAAEIVSGAAPVSSSVIHIFGPEEITFGQVAETVSGAIGKTVAHVVVGADQFLEALTGMGVSRDAADQLLELETAIANHLVAPPEGSTVRTGTTTFTQFAREVVAPAYQGAAGAASV